MPRSQRQHRIPLVTAMALSAALVVGACGGNSKPNADGAAPAAQTTSEQTTNEQPTSAPPTSDQPTSAATPTDVGDGIGAAPPKGDAASAGHGVGALNAAPFPGDAALSDAQQPRHDDRSVSATIKVENGLHLHDGWFHATDRWSGTSLPDGNISGTSGIYLIKGFAPGFVVKWQIYDDADKPTGYWVGAKFYTPAAGTNKWSCLVYHGDPGSEDEELDPFSQYSCLWSNTGGWNPKPVLTIASGTVVTSKVKGKQLLQQYCNGSNAARNCRFTNFGYGTALSDSKLVGQVVKNDGEHDGTGEGKTGYDVRWATETKWTNSIGVEWSNSVKLFEVWESTLTVKYEYSWEKSEKFDEVTHIEVAPEMVGWVEFAPRMQTTVGTWAVVGGGQRYLIPNVSLSSPLRDGGVITSTGCKLVDYKDEKCTKPLTPVVVQQ